MSSWPSLVRTLFSTWVADSEKWLQKTGNISHRSPYSSLLSLQFRLDNWWTMDVFSAGISCWHAVHDFKYKLIQNQKLKFRVECAEWQQLSCKKELITLYSSVIHCVSKKQATVLLFILLPNINRFSKFFLWHFYRQWVTERCSCANTFRCDVFILCCSRCIQSVILWIFGFCCVDTFLSLNWLLTSFINCFFFILVTIFSYF